MLRLTNRNETLLFSLLQSPSHQQSKSLLPLSGVETFPVKCYALGLFFSHFHMQKAVLGLLAIFLCYKIRQQMTPLAASLVLCFVLQLQVCR